MQKEPLNLLFIGFGNVGRKLASILSVEKAGYSGLTGFSPRVIGIITRRHGALVNYDGLKLRDVLAFYQNNAGFNHKHPDFTEMDAKTAVNKLPYNVLVELSTLSIADRGEPARSYIQSALEQGKHVVSANKGPLAFSYLDLKLLADRNDCMLLHEATVMDGTPVFNLARTALYGCQITRVSGILTSTTNYILTAMEGGVSFDQALHQIQVMGIAEADPTYDIDGWDSAAKICILANAFLSGCLTPLQIPRQGIREISGRDIETNSGQGKKLKLIGSAWMENNRAAARVAVESIPIDHPFANIRGTGSVLQIETDLMSPLIIAHMSPGLNDTAFGVINDLLTISREFQRD
jgi:homoserine dehydrogenase